MTIRAIDLFCGGGGSSWGAALAGVQMVGAVDACPIATATYADNFPTAAGNVITKRLEIGTGSELFTDLGDVDLLIASPECTNHSIARGARPRCEISRNSGWLVMPFLQQLRPRWIVLENVGGMIRWEGWGELRRALEAEGYSLRIHQLDAADYGVPQRRRRVFVTGDRRRQPEVLQAISPHRPASEIIDRSTGWATTPLYKPGRAQSTLDRAEAAIEALGKGTEFLIVYYGSDKAGGWQTLDRPLRTLTTLDRFGLVQWDLGRNPTLRMLQVPELKNAMGLSTGYQLSHGSRRDKVRLIGNGVAPPVMQAVVEALIRPDLIDLAALPACTSISPEPSVDAAIVIRPASPPRMKTAQTWGEKPWRYRVRGPSASRAMARYAKRSSVVDAS